MEVGKMKPSRLLLTGAAALLLSACYTAPIRPPALDDARIAVESARANPQVASYAPTELHDAVATYQRAESLLRRDGDSDEVRHLSYLARQRAAIAQELARTRAAEQSMAAAAAERERVLLAAREREAEEAARAARAAEAQAESARRAAQEAQAQARAAQQQSAAAQQQAAAAQQRAQSASERNAQLEMELRELYATKSDRGMVVTLNDVLFDTGSAQLRPGGYRLVTRLAEFLREYPERTIAIEGFTDSVGSDDMNQELSERRAASVKLALIDAGIDPSRVYVRGYGEAFPVATNDTREAERLVRAWRRTCRVDIAANVPR
jgi:outer membrane protein OmpA-like peptidoglycan-associated protein